MFSSYFSHMLDIVSQLFNGLFSPSFGLYNFYGHILKIKTFSSAVSSSDENI